MIVCVCHRVSDREIARHVQRGMDFSDIQLELGVATQCGQCEGCAREVVEQCMQSLPEALAPPLPSFAPVRTPIWLSSAA